MHKKHQERIERHNIAYYGQNYVILLLPMSLYAFVCLLIRNYAFVCDSMHSYAILEDTPEKAFSSIALALGLPNEPSPFQAPLHEVVASY